MITLSLRAFHASNRPIPRGALLIVPGMYRFLAIMLISSTPNVKNRPYFSINYSQHLAPHKIRLHVSLKEETLGRGGNLSFYVSGVTRSGIEPATSYTQGGQSITEAIQVVMRILSVSLG